MVLLLDLDSAFDPLIGTTVYLPENTLFYGPLGVTDQATPYTSMKTANAFTNPQRLQLLDLRYIQLLLKELFSTRNDNAELEPMARVTIAYGLCSLQDQVKLIEAFLAGRQDAVKDIQAYYRDVFQDVPWEDRPLTMNPFTPDGIRFSDPANDALCGLFLKGVFGHLVDGYVAPRFHTVLGSINAEMVLFDPQKAGLQEWPALDLFDKFCKVTLKQCHMSHRQFRVAAKELYPIPYPTADPQAKMERFAQNKPIYDPYAPHPTLPLRPWCQEEIEKSEIIDISQTEPKNDTPV